MCLQFSRKTFFARHHYDIQIKKEDNDGTCDLQNKRNAQKIVSGNFENLQDPVVNERTLEYFLTNYCRWVYTLTIWLRIVKSFRL